ncbi:MAG: chemotaxis protein CheW [Ectothiorhodospiraceae bacterium]|nr:chemotaxis protein CheW [Ectothiorhodospiraceae bacterium]
MQKKPYETHTLLEPKRAIRVYLDALLCEATLTATEETLLTTVDVVTDTCDDTKQTVSPEPVIETAVTTETKTPALPVKTTARLNALRSTVTAEPHIEKAHIATIENESAEPAEKNSEDDSTVYLPDWAENRFQCLSFQVAGVTLAAPLEKLHGILELTEQITELPGYAPWALGLLPNRGQNVHVVDIAKIIMPDNKQVDTVPALERVNYLVLIDGGKYGLVADSISQVLTLESDDVRWRSQKSRRPWLAGTVINKMCALLEIDSLCLQLKAGLTEPE